MKRMLYIFSSKLMLECLTDCGFYFSPQ